ncbi:hypothetical protein CSB90_3450 [Pseudomonas aeruginosa]|nr:hypothetical protein CSB90_3450 [Pseudomonas aeruginosa]
MSGDHEANHMPVLFHVFLIVINQAVMEKVLFQAQCPVHHLGK